MLERMFGRMILLQLDNLTRRLVATCTLGVWGFRARRFLVSRLRI